MKSIIEYTFVGLSVIAILVILFFALSNENNKQSNKPILGSRVQIKDPFFTNCQTGIVLNQNLKTQTYKILLLCNPQEVFISNTYEIPEENLSVLH